MPAIPVPVTMSTEASRRFQRAHEGLGRAARRDLHAAVGRHMRVAARPVVTATRAAYRALEDVSPAARVGPQARATVARAVKLQVRATGPNPSMRIYVDLEAVPVDMRSLVWAWERGRWRHPVFANPAQTRSQWRWVTQRVDPPFRRGTRGHGAAFRRAVDGAVREVLGDLNR